MKGLRRIPEGLHQAPLPPQRAPGNAYSWFCTDHHSLSCFQFLLYQLPPCAFKIPSSSSRARAPQPACTQLSPGRASSQAGGSSTFHAECIKVPVNCALTSQGELGKAPLGLVLLGGPAGESISGCPRKQPPGATEGPGRGSSPQPLPPQSCPPQ